MRRSSPRQVFLPTPVFFLQFSFRFTITPSKQHFTRSDGNAAHRLTEPCRGESPGSLYPTEAELTLSPSQRSGLQLPHRLPPAWVPGGAGGCVATSPAVAPSGLSPRVLLPVCGYLLWVETGSCLWWLKPPSQGAKLSARCRCGQSGRQDRG